VLRVATAGLKGGEHLLTGDEAHYVQRVHRRVVGDDVWLFDPDAGVEALATLLAFTSRGVVCRIGEVKDGTRRGVAGLRLIQGVGKGDKGEQVVKHAVALGVQSIEFVVCERSVSRPTPRDAEKELRLRRVAVDAARQCGRSNVPAIGMSLPWAQSITNATATGLVVALHTDPATTPLETLLAETNPAVISVVVGPEGGLSDHEVQVLKQQAARFASLGELILRTELAAVVALARAGAWLSGQNADRARQFDPSRVAPVL
jgi:16S rRNA (uracil1498-N3)-methyltransferase